MPDETTVTAQGGETTPPSPEQTSAPSTTPTTPPPPAPPSLTRDDVSAMLREELGTFLPNLTDELRKSMGEQFASREEIQRTTQSATDKAYARMMKQLGPQMKGIDRLVAKGRMTQEDAEAAKLSLLSDSTSSFADEEDATPAPAPRTPTAPQPPMPPAYDPQKATQQAAEQLMRDSGLKWEDVTPDMFSFRSSMKRDMSLAEFTKLVGKKVADKEKTNLVAQAKREYEQQTKAVREADKNGATQVPPQGGAAGHTPKATLDDADDIGDVLRNKFFPGT